MKKYFIFTIFLIFISCQAEQMEEEKVNTSSSDLDYPSRRRSADWQSGFFLKREQKALHSKKPAFFLNICEYKTLELIPTLSGKEANLLEKSPNIPKQYGLYHREKSKNVQMIVKPKIYYEITDARDWQGSKVSGKLYWIGYSKMIPTGGVYISDTTEEYGWFVVLFPHKYPSQHEPELILDTQIKSMHPKAQELCGNYERLSWNPYRLIRDEEVEDVKPKK